MSETRDKWTEEARRLLLGKTITDVRYLPMEDAEGMDWYASSVEFFAQNPDGTGKVSVLAQGDDEGNMGGVLNVVEMDENMRQSMLPVVS